MQQGDHQVRVELDERGGGLVATVTIDNPRRLNSLNSALMDEFVAVIGRIGRQ